MSKLSGDRARFQKDRKRKLRHRERLHVVMAGVQKRAGETAASRKTGPGATGDKSQS